MRKSCCAASDVSTFGVLTRVPPAIRWMGAGNLLKAGGTHYPQRSRGSEFNPLAPHMPEGLNGSQGNMTRQPDEARAPPGWGAWRAIRQPLMRHQKRDRMQYIAHEWRQRKMSTKDKTQYTSRLSVHITPAMNTRLEQIAALRDEAKAEVVRAALRTYLDEQEDLIGSRKHFTKMFQRRMDYLEWVVMAGVWMNLHVWQLLTERLKKEQVDLSDLLVEMLWTAVDTQGEMMTILDQVHRRKTKPPRQE